jgi:hypothetical protein
MVSITVDEMDDYIKAIDRGKTVPKKAVYRGTNEKLQTNRIDNKKGNGNCKTVPGKNSTI